MKNLVTVLILSLLCGVMQAERIDESTAAINPRNNPPLDLSYAVDGNDVTLNWVSPETPTPGEWITWCQDVLGNSIGTNAPAVFDVAHRFTQADLAAHQGGMITQVKFVPMYQNCVYTVKVWIGCSAYTVGSLVSSQLVQGPIIDEWNLCVLNTPVPIPSTGDIYVGYECNTQGEFPAGCDAGPRIEGKGNMMYFQGAWTTLYELSPNLTYNWLIQTFVTDGAAMKAVELKPIAENRSSHHSPAPLALRTKSIQRANDRVLAGYKVYRDGILIRTIGDPQITIFTDMDLPNGTYIYGVTAVYTTGESAPASVSVTVNVQLAEIIFEDDFEAHADFALLFSPWILVDMDLSVTYGFPGVNFPGSGGPMAYIIFNPSATVPPMANITAHSGDKMAACFAAFPSPNSDWMITPRLHLGTNSSLKFYAKSHTDIYGLEHFRVGVSLFPSVISQGFQYVSPGDYTAVPVNWTEYAYDLSNYDNQDVFIGVRCVSNDAFVFYLDDISVNSNGGYIISTGITQSIPLAGGWNLVSLNVSPLDNRLSTLLAPISSQILQVKGTEGVYVPGNPYSTLTYLNDGKAYNIQLSSAADWNVTGDEIPANTPLTLNNGWNMTAYLPQSSMDVSTAMQSISTWLQQVKGNDGVYAPDNPYSTLSTMYPGKGYWINISGVHNLVYPGRGASEQILAPIQPTFGQADSNVVLKTSSAVVLARCDCAGPGDVLLARASGELRGRESLISPEAFYAALIQIYCEEGSEEISFSILKPDGQELPLATRVDVEPGRTYGVYPNFLILEPAPLAAEDAVALETGLRACYPNPFNPSTTVKYDVAENNTPVAITIYNLKGQKVRSLVDGSAGKGQHFVVWNAQDDAGHKVASGIYFATMQAPGINNRIKILLTK